MTSIWDIQRNFLPVFLFLPIFQTGEGVREPSVVVLSVVYRVIIEVIFQRVIKQPHPSPVHDIIVEFSTEAHGAPPALQVMSGSVLEYSPLYSISLVLRVPTQLIWGLRNGRECCFIISFCFCFSLSTAAEIFHLSCGFFDYYNAVTKVLALHFSG